MTPAPIAARVLVAVAIIYFGAHLAVSATDPVIGLLTAAATILLALAAVELMGYNPEN